MFSLKKMARKGLRPEQNGRHIKFYLDVQIDNNSSLIQVMP